MRTATIKKIQKEDDFNLLRGYKIKLIRSILSAFFFFSFNKNYDMDIQLNWIGPSSQKQKI